MDIITTVFLKMISMMGMILMKKWQKKKTLVIACNIIVTKMMMSDSDI